MTGLVTGLESPVSAKSKVRTLNIILERSSAVSTCQFSLLLSYCE